MVYIRKKKKGKNVALFWNLFRLIFLSSISLSSSSRIVMFRVLLLRFLTRVGISSFEISSVILWIGGQDKSDFRSKIVGER